MTTDSSADLLLPTNAYYDAVAPHFDQELAQRQSYVAGVDRIVALWAARRQVKNLIDVGCGNGRRLKHLMDETGVAGLGIDVSPAMVDAARRLGVIAHLGDIAADGFELQWHGRTTEMVVALWNVLGHVHGPAQRVRAMRNMRSLLSNHGMIIFDVNNRHNASAYGWTRVLRNVACDVLGMAASGDFIARRTVNGQLLATVTHLFSMREVQALAVQAGFDIQHTYCINYQHGTPTRTRWGGQICLVAEAC